MKMLKQLGFIIITALLAVNVSAALPQTTTDGLVLQPDTKLRAVYMKPGANLKEYTEVALLAAYVAFAKNWERDYNEQAIGLEDRVSDKDMARIRKEVAEEFQREFAKVLTEAGYKMVTTGGTGVLIVRPAIINLQVTAPDLMTAGMSASFVASAGQMTLYMELLDGKTGDLIARIIDPEADQVGGYANSVTNKADADIILRRWAHILANHLGAVKAPK